MTTEPMCNVMPGGSIAFSDLLGNSRNFGFIWELSTLYYQSLVLSKGKAVY